MYTYIYIYMYTYVYNKLNITLNSKLDRMRSTLATEPKSFLVCLFNVSILDV